MYETPFARRRTYQCESASCVSASAEESFNFLLLRLLFGHGPEQKPRDEKECGLKFPLHENQRPSTETPILLVRKRRRARRSRPGGPGRSHRTIRPRVSTRGPRGGHPASVSGALLPALFSLLTVRLNEALARTISATPSARGIFSISPANKWGRAHCGKSTNASRARRSMGGAKSIATILTPSPSRSLARRASNPAPHPNSTAVRTPLRSTPSSRYPQPQYEDETRLGRPSMNPGG